MHANATFWDDADTDEVETMEQILLGSMVDAQGIDRVVGLRCLSLELGSAPPSGLSRK